MGRSTEVTVDEPVQISSIKTTARVGEDEQPAVVIWFENDTALRYVWDGDEIQEQTYVDGVVHESFGVGGERGELAEYALESVAEYIGHFRDNLEDAENDWPHIYEMLAVEN